MLQRRGIRKILAFIFALTLCCAAAAGYAEKEFELKRVGNINSYGDNAFLVCYQTRERFHRNVVRHRIVVVVNVVLRLEHFLVQRELHAFHWLVGNRVKLDRPQRVALVLDRHRWHVLGSRFVHLLNCVITAFGGFSRTVHVNYRLAVFHALLDSYRIDKTQVAIRCGGLRQCVLLVVL